LFKEANTAPLSTFVLQTPKQKRDNSEKQLLDPSSKMATHRSSPRLKEKGSKGKTIIKMTQEIVA
jgi:hypothetical protein